MHVQKRDGRKEAVHFDKITARITKLAYGLSAEFCDPVSSEQRSFFSSFRNASLVQCWTTTARGGGSRPSFSTRCYPETAFKPPRTIRARSSLRPELDKRGTRAPPNAPFRSRRFLLTSPPAIDNRKKTLSPPLSLSSTTGSRRPEGRHGRLQGRHHDRAR